jgi:hypothetical protein
MQIWFKMDLAQSHLRTSFKISSIVFPFFLIELGHRVSLTLYSTQRNYTIRKVIDVITWLPKSRGLKTM